MQSFFMHYITLICPQQQWQNTIKKDLFYSTSLFAIKTLSKIQHTFCLFPFFHNKSSILADKKVSFPTYFSFPVITKAKETGFPFVFRALINVMKHFKRFSYQKIQ